MLREDIDRAIREQLVLEFRYGGGFRVVAPHYHVTSPPDPVELEVIPKGHEHVFGWQLDGHSVSGKPAGWRLFETPKIDELVVLRTHFTPLPHDRDRLFDEFGLTGSIVHQAVTSEA